MCLSIKSVTFPHGTWGVPSRFLWFKMKSTKQIKISHVVTRSFELSPSVLYQSRLHDVALLQIITLSGQLPHQKGQLVGPEATWDLSSTEPLNIPTNQGVPRRMSYQGTAKGTVQERPDARNPIAMVLCLEDRGDHKRLEQSLLSGSFRSWSNCVNCSLVHDCFTKIVVYFTHSARAFQSPLLSPWQALHLQH